MARIETIRDRINKIRTPFLYTNEHEDINVSVGLRRATDLCDDLYATLWRATEDIHAHELRGGPWVPSSSDDDSDHPVDDTEPDQGVGE